MFGTSASAAAPKTTWNLQTMPLLQAARNPDLALARGGGDITIVDDTSLLPESGPSGTLADIQEAQSTQISVYVVREGDTLSSIAKLFGVTANTIFWANDLKSVKDIHPGDTLVILPISGVRYTVKKGDTIASVAKKFKADVADIISYNNLGDGGLSVGADIIIPDGEIAAPPAPVRGNPYRGGSGPSYTGYYIAPLAHYTRTQGLHGYNGVDLAAPYGSSVLASANGTVIIVKNVGYNGGYGEYIVISHPNGTQTLYAHLSRTIVSVGQSVVQGQVIGYEGATGKATGPHVHFEIRGAKNPF